MSSPPDKLQDWLDQHGLGRYYTTLVENDINWSVLTDLSESDWAELGLSLGHRKQMLKAVAALSDDPAADPLPAQKTSDAERRQLSVMFCDLAGSTELSARLDPEDLRDLIRAYQQACERVITRYDGFIAKYMGDGILVYFGYPNAHEDDATRAIQTALAIIAEMAPLNQDKALNKGARLAVRIGIATGVVIVGDMIGAGAAQELTVLGEAPNLAARLQDQAGQDQAVLDTATMRLAGRGFAFADLGRRELKGFAEPLRIWQVTGNHQSGGLFATPGGRELTPLVGRDAELDSLHSSWRHALAGQGAMVNIAGEAGIGKSRLVYEFCRTLGNDLMLLEGYCSATGQRSAFLPFVDVVTRSFHIEHRHSAAEKVEQLSKGLHRLELTQQQYLPYLANLLNLPVDDELKRLDAEVIGVHTRAALAETLRACCRRLPTVLMIEDLHWIDPVSESLLQILAGSVQHMPLLVLCTYRPEYQPPWSAGSGYETLALNPLSHEHIKAIAGARLAVSELSDAIASLVIEKATGNPLFAEEIASHLLETGSVQLISQTSAIAADNNDVSFAVPSTLAGLLMARIDQLSDEARALLQCAAVIGRQFPAELVNLASGMGDRASPYLAELEQRGLLFYDGIRDGYGFRQALLRDALYDSLLRGERQRLHEAVGHACEQLYADQLQAIADDMVRHFSHSDDLKRKLRYLVLAGEKSLQIYDIQAAAERFQQALALLEADSGLADGTFVADLVLHQIRIHYFNADFAAMSRLAEQYLPMFERLGDSTRLGRCLAELGYSYVFAERTPEGRPYLEQALELGQSNDDPTVISYAALGMAWSYVVHEPDSQRQRDKLAYYFDLTWTHGKQTGNTWILAKALYVKCIDALTRGNPKAMREICFRLMDLHRETNDPRPKVFALIAESWLDAYSWDMDSALSKAEECLQLSLSPIDRIMAMSAKAQAYAIAQQPALALPIMEQIMLSIEGKACKMPVSVLHPSYGAALVGSGEMARGVALIEDHIRYYRSINADLTATLGELVLGEVYLVIALGEQRPPLSVMLKNFAFLVKTLPRAAKKAEHYLNCAREHCHDVAPAYYAWALMNLGRLALHKKRRDDARTCFENALQAAQSVDAFALCERLQSLLAE